MNEMERRWVEHRDHAITVILKAHPELRASVGNYHGGGYDCVFYSGDDPVSICDVTERLYYDGEMPLTEKMIRNGGYMVSWDMVDKLKKRADNLDTTCSLIINLATEGKVVVINLTTGGGDFIPRIHINVPKTKATHGGPVEKINAVVYPDARCMRIYPYSAPGMVVIPQ